MTATALINFGALVAFTFVNLSVFNHFWRRKVQQNLEGSTALSAAADGRGVDGRVLWINLEATSLTLGLVWAALGLLYLTYLTRRFRKPPPQFDAAKAEQAWES